MLGGAVAIGELRVHDGCLTAAAVAANYAARAPMYVATPTPTSTSSITSTSTLTPSGTTTPTATPYCAATLFAPLPRTDLVGTLVGANISPSQPSAAFIASSEAACREACCLVRPACTAYTFMVSTLLLNPSGAQCYVYSNVTALVPNSGYTSGALQSVYS